MTEAPVTVALLRGVNVGGRNRLPMAQLRSICESIGGTQVETYIQSGNVVFRGSAAGLSEAIEQATGLRIAVVSRTLPELESLVAADPMADENGEDGAKVLVYFLGAALSPAAREAIASLPPVAERVWVTGAHVWIDFPNGMARPELNVAQLERLFGVTATGRNWNTVRKLLAMARAVAASGRP